MTRHRFTAATCALLLTLSAPAPADQKPTPPPSSGTLPKGSAPSVPLVTVSQKPDLVVSFEGSGPGLPTGFTVKNIGNVDSKLSVLKVTAAFVPPAPSASGGTAGGCLPFMTPEQCEALGAWAAGFLGALASTANGGGTSTDTIKKACGNPFGEFLEAVPVLKPGESKTFMRDAGPYQVSLSGFISQATSPQTTHVKKCSPTLVCAWDVTAVADASNDNDERNEANNTSTRRALREVSFK